MILDQPPRRLNSEQQPRRVGVEIEFAGLDAPKSADILCRELGGRVRQDGPHQAHLLGSSLGDFTIELDMAGVHPKAWMDSPPAHPADDLSATLEGKLRDWLGQIGGLVMPMEVSTPPLLIADLPRLDAAFEALAAAGAQGTDAGLLFAFGLHLNPDAAQLSASYITTVLKAYLALSDWLRLEIRVDRLRRISSFVDPFPADYCRLVCAEDYHPTMDRLIADYLDYNPSRNRELDMLPLFAFIAPQRVRGQLPNVKINPRPTFHYRLPNALLGRPGWSVVGEWNRWVVVERLADTPDLLGEVLTAYRQHLDAMFTIEWTELDWFGNSWAKACGRLIADDLRKPD